MTNIRRPSRRHLLAAALILAAASSLLAIAPHRSTSPVVSTAVTSQPKIHFSRPPQVLGDTVSRDGYSVQVVADSMGAIDQSTGLRRYTVRISIHNLAANVLQVSPGLQMTVLDTSGTAYPMTAAYLPSDAVVGGPIEPGGSDLLSIDFALPDTAMPVEFQFQPDAAATATKVGL